MATTADKLVSEFRALPAEEKLRLLDMIFTEMDTPDPEKMTLRNKRTKTSTSKKHRAA